MTATGGGRGLTRLLLVALLGGLAMHSNAAGGETGAEAPLAFLERHGVRLALSGTALVGDRVPDEPAVRQTVEAWNAGRTLVELDDLQALNPRRLNPDEVLLFVAGLARQPEAVLAKVAGAGPLDLAREQLGLHFQDGLGPHGLTAPWRLEGEGPFHVEPALDAVDAAADREAAAAGEKHRQAALDAARDVLARLDRSSADFPPAFRAEAQARVRLAAVQGIRLAATRRLLSLSVSAAELGGHPRADLEREVERLREALKSAPPAGGMPGGIRPTPR
jgi:hypothetical protein